jgi:(p)ppGpp synthase/HD superfamily hydrolase
VHATSTISSGLLKDKAWKKQNSKFEIYGRPKSIHSIWNKMKKKGVAFEEVYDLFAIRILLMRQWKKKKKIAGKCTA